MVRYPPIFKKKQTGENFEANQSSACVLNIPSGGLAQLWNLTIMITKTTTNGPFSIAIVKLMVHPIKSYKILIKSSSITIKHQY